MSSLTKVVSLAHCVADDFEESDDLVGWSVVLSRIARETEAVMDVFDGFLAVQLGGFHVAG